MVRPLSPDDHPLPSGGQGHCPKLYDTAATSAIFRTSPLDRHMRDILTACQHRVVHLKMYRPAGCLLLGLDPEELFF